MPTKKQLSSIWESQLEYFGGSGQPMQTYGSSSDENGLTTKKHVDTPMVIPNNLSDFEGEEIGIITFDPENKDLKIIVTT
jgi:hypothetical protein